MGDARYYPNGKGANFYTKFVAGVLNYYKRSTGALIGFVDGANSNVSFPGMVKTLRARVPLATVNAGGTLLAAVPGLRYRMISCKIISIGGAAGAGTTVDILGTIATVSSKLVAFAQASLTQSAVLKDGGTGATVLADGGSYVQCDANTPITIGKTGSNFTVATNFDVNLTFALEP